MNFIAKLGQNPQFVAFWAHLGMAALFVEHMPHHIVAAASVIVGGAVKEFWYDATYEMNPDQSSLDNYEDWVGWLLGAFLGLVLGGH